MKKKVLHNRSEKNRVGGILLLSDGKDKQILKECQANMARKSLEESDTDIAQRRQFATYTFGFGTNHDSRTLYYLAREGYGTYSFANEGSRNMEDAMALCIGGLTSIVSQDVEITIEAAHPEVKISEIKSGLHKNDFIGRETRCSRIQIRDLYGDEEKNFLVCVNVPEEEGHSASVATETSLLTVKARYRNPLTMDDSNTNEMKKAEQMMIKVDEAKVCVERPPTPTEMLAGQDSSMSPEVETEIHRVHILDRVLNIWDGIATASHHWTYVFEAGVKCWGVRGVDKDRVLDQLNKLLGDVDPTANPSSNPDMAALRRKLYNDIIKMRDDGMAKDVAAGLPYMLSWLSSHGWQRAGTRGVASDSSFLTVRMQNMIASVETALAK